MNADILFRVAIGVAAVAAAAWPLLKPRIETLLKLSPSAPGDTLAADAHTVMSIALRLKDAGKAKSAELARSLIASILTE
jgi:hypothetical protein